jgi:hypothetical protein
MNAGSINACHANFDVVLENPLYDEPQKGLSMRRLDLIRLSGTNDWRNLGVTFHAEAPRSVMSYTNAMFVLYGSFAVVRWKLSEPSTWHSFRLWQPSFAA